MILYLAVAAGVFFYYTHGRNFTLGKRVVLAFLWPLTFFMYLFSAMTGRSTQNFFAASGGRRTSRGRRGRKR